jgi:DNA polymerase-3 subunit alpha
MALNQPAFAAKDFVHLHLHTDYSLLQSTVQLKPLAKRLAELDQKACAMTDYGNMYGAVSFFNTMSYAGIKPIIGVDAHLIFGSRHDRSSSVESGERGYYNIVLIAENIEGYKNLVQISSRAFTEGFHHKPRVDMELLNEFGSGLIGIGGGIEGPIGHFLINDNCEKAAANAGLLQDLFGKGKFFLEVQDHVDERGTKCTRETITTAKRLDIPLLATNDVHYLRAEDGRAQKLLIAIGEGRTIGEFRETSSAIRYLRSTDEMWEIFGSELPDSLTNTVRIAEMCSLEIPQGDDVRQLPSYPIPPEFGQINEEDYFEKVLWDGFEERKQTTWEPMMELGMLKHSLAEYEERLRIEIATIRRMGFPGYFLIVWDFIAYAKRQGIPVGPGRGSAAGSLAAYCMKITDVDPIQYDLLFERFLNPERISMPDIDIDFCIRGRGDVIKHVSEFYGADSVCQIVTFGTMASRAAIKDVGRALNMPFGDVERVAKLIPPPIRGRNVSITMALEMVPELKAAVKDPKVKELVDLALRLEGCARHTSVHAAGVVISPKPLHELVPVARNQKDELTSQYPMGDLEKVGMLKMDFLGLTTLTMIADCLASMKERLNVTVDWTKIPTNDPKTMQLFADGRTEAIFQFESSGMADMCRRLRPKDLEDLSALNALYRPGPLDGGMIDDFIDRHKGLKPVEYSHPELEAILGNTLGVLVYQEQIMQIAQRLAGYSLGQADLMRRAMGKKKIEEMAIHEETFVNGAVGNNIPKKLAKEIFDLMAKFADYGFNRSHSMAYAVLAFQTAYLKAHYPANFYASVLSHEAQDSAKVYKYSTELKSLGLQLLPPDVNESGSGFTPVDDTVRYGLTAIKGMGASSVDAIVEARRGRKFTSLFDFCSRMAAGAVNRRGLESLIAAGAFDSLTVDDTPVGLWRAKLFNSIDMALQAGQRMAEDRMRGQSALFGAVETAAAQDEMPDCDAWSQSEIAKREKAAIGFYLSAHPLDTYKDLLDGFSLLNIAEIDESRSGEMTRLAGLVSGLQIRTSKKGNRFAMFRFEDRSSGMKAVVLGESFTKLSPMLADDRMFIADGKIEASDGQEPTLMINELLFLEDAYVSRARSLHIAVPGTELDTKYFEDLFSTLERQRGGGTTVKLTFTAGPADVCIESGSLTVSGTPDLQKELERQGCRVEWVH